MPSAERAALSTAIELVQQWSRYLSRCREALATLDAEVQARGQALVDAENALKELQTDENAPKAALRRALAGETAGPSRAAAVREVETARAAYTESSEQRGLARTEIERLEANELRRAQHAVRESIAAVLRAEGVIDGLLQEREALLTRVNGIDNALRTLVFAMSATKANTFSYKKSPAEYPPDESVAGPYRAAIKALETDPAAPLPGGGDPAPAPRAAAA